MNRNLIKWLLIVAVIIGAAAYFILSEMPSGQRQEKQGKEKIVVGHSKAFKIEPIEGITISAAENALDKDRKFKLTAVDDKTYNRVVKRMEEEAKVNPLFVFELDAGLRPDDYFPGDYHVEVDLNKMGIPKILQDRICVYRIAGSGKEEVYVPYSSRVVDGKLSFNSNQNSLMMFALTPHDIAIELLNNIRGTLHFIFETGASAGKSLQRYFYNEPTRIEIPIKHPSGDFTLKFRWRDTEDPDGFNAYMANEEAFFKRLDELEKQAHDNYEAKVQKEFDKEGITIWDKVFSPNQVQAIRDRINYQTELQSLFVKDSLIAKLQADPASKPPKSIQNIIQDVVRANEYLNSIGLHHLNFELPIYLVNDEVMKKKEGKPNDKNSGVAQKYWVSGNAFMLLRYEVSELTPQSTTGW